jgi:uncharacterized OB-fold protein
MTAWDGEVLAADLFTADEQPAPGQPIRLRASHCTGCDRWEFPALQYCPACSGPVEEAKLSGQAVVAGVSAVLHAPPGALVEAPYTVALAAFPEGVAVLGVVTAPFEDVALGQSLQTVGMQVGSRVGYGYRPI